LVRQSSGRDWETTLPLKAGRYRYKFLLNQAHWIADPAATVFESDGFGGRCSVLIVK
jgi:1,4-alpha-glucan branching enzyme